MAGAARVAITPRLDLPGRPVYMAGLERGLKATGVADELYARALVMTDPRGTSVGLVVLDLIGFFHDDVEALRQELARKHPGIALAHVAVASTHTHAGPDVIGLWTPIGGSVDDAYMAEVRSGAVEALASAWASRRPAEMRVGVGTAPGMAKDTRLPELIDETVLALGLRTPSGDGIASLVNWNSHPSVTGGENSLLSADYPKGLVARMEREWGGVALFAAGDLGGQIGSARVRVADPATGKVPEDRLRKAEILGDRIAGIALAALGEAASRPPAEVRLAARSRTLFVPMDNPRFAEGLAIGLIRPRRLYALDGQGAGLLPSELPDRSALRPGAFTLKTEVAVVDLGPARMALVPGELYPELALGGIPDPQDPGADFQGAEREPPLRPMSDQPLFLIGLANDELGYIIPRSQWDSEPPYAYQRDEPQYGERNSVGPATAPLIMNAFRELLAPR
ncbi:MAG TPA: hypothetical protein VJV23_04020 [Candidatus Polarisedimenticolia bacterium]|nr:hypothetical protein [Candidatus Polarisedimenticolia bacterium]